MASSWRRRLGRRTRLLATSWRRRKPDDLAQMIRGAVAKFFPLVAAIVGAWFATACLTQAQAAGGLLAAGVGIALCFSPFGKIRFGEKSQTLPWWRWFVAYSALQGCVLLLMLIYLRAFVGFAPELIQSQLNPAQMLAALYQDLPYGCVFPWGLYSMVAVLFLAHIHYKKHVPLISHMILKPEKTLWRQWFEAYTDLIVVQIHTFIWVLGILASVLLIMGEVQRVYAMAPPYLYPSLFSMGFMILSWKQKAIARFMRTMQRRGFHFFMLLLVIWGILFTLWLILGHINTRIYESTGAPVLDSAQSSLLHFNALATPLARWRALYISMLVAQSLWVASYIAAISQGRTLRAIIGMGFFWPVVIELALPFVRWPGIPTSMVPLLSFVAGAFVFGWCAWFVRNHHSMRVLAQMGLPDRAPRKFYSVSKMTKYLVNYAFLMGALFSILAWYFIQVLSLAVATGVLCITIGLVRGLYHRPV